MTDDDRSIADLCAPISAKTMPRSKLYNPDSTTMSNDEALMHQRRTEFLRVMTLRKSRRESVND